MIHDWLKEGNNIQVLTDILKGVLSKQQNCDIFYLGNNKLYSVGWCYDFGLNKNESCIRVLTSINEPDILRISCNAIMWLHDIRKKNTLLNSEQLIIEKLQYHIRGEKLNTILQ